MSSSGNVPHIIRVFIFMGTVIFSTSVFAVEMNATLQWVRTVPLSTTVSGVVDKVTVDKGSRVQAGKVLLNLVGKAFKADVTARKAELLKAENNDVEAQLEKERTQELYDRTLLSDHDLQLVEIQRDAATSALLTARASLVRAERDYYYSVVRAPFDAWVLQRNAQPGQAVIVKLQAEPLLVLAEAGRMLARGSVSGSNAEKLVRGGKAKVAVAGKTFNGKVSFISMEPIKKGVDEYAIEIIFSSGKSILRVGQTAKVTF